MTERTYITLDLGISQLAVVDDQGFLGVQADVYGEEDSGAPPMELHHPAGFRSMPRDPESDGTGCAILYGWQGNAGHAWLGADARDIPLLPKPKKGSSTWYPPNGKGAWADFDGDTGTLTFYVPVEWDGSGKPTKASTLTFGVDTNGRQVFTLLMAGGQRIEATNSAADKNPITIANVANNAWVMVNDDGVEVNGNLKVSGSFTPRSASALGVWIAAVTAALSGLGAPPGPPPIVP